MNFSLSDFLPPIAAKLAKKVSPIPKSTYGWFGNYASWAEAEKHCTGYNHKAVLEKTIAAAKQVANGKARYERDSCTFDHVEYSWPILAALLNSATLDNGKLSVVDFGGSLGSTFHQNQEFLNGLKVSWAVVEQPSVVAAGKQNFTTENLRFFDTIETALHHQSKQVLLLSSVLQYLENPSIWIEQFLSFDFPYIVIDRTSFINTPNNRITVQRVPPEIYEASYPCHFFFEAKLLELFLGKYELVADFPSFCDSEEQADDYKRLYWKGFILKRK